MARLNIIVEGHSEEAFVNGLLVAHLARYDVSAVARRVETSREKSKRTAPSKRIIRLFPDYGEPGGKRIVGPLLAEAAGLAKIRAACLHFDEWLTRLEQLAR